MGFRPIILERGRSVRERTHDVWGFWRERRLDPESNVQFGEGGAQFGLGMFKAEADFSQSQHAAAV